LTRRDAFRNGIEWLQQSARLMRAVTPDGFLCDWGELDNKIEAFRLFQYADRELHVSADRAARNAGDTFRSIWVLEGAGHMAGMASSLSVHGLLTAGAAAKLPDCAMVPLHAGMGTAFAEKLFAGLPSNPSAAEIGATVRHFVNACRANCRPGWEDACVEPFGLVVRCLYPGLLSRVSTAAEEVSPALRHLFWHGVGRGLYFVPTNFLPISGARERMLKNAAEEADDTDDRRNVLAGLIWAVTLVNLKRPAVIGSVAAICSRLKLQDVFINGLISALMAWRHMAPADEREIAPYLRLQPGMQPRSRAEQALWKAWIETPARDALHDISPGLQLRNNIPALYTYRTHEELCRLSAAANGVQI